MSSSHWSVLAVLGATASLGHAGTPAAKTYTISTDDDAGGIHVTKLTAAIPGWSEEVDKKGSPEFHKDPVGMLAILNVLHTTPEAAIKGLFYDAKNPQTTTKAGRTWIVSRAEDGHVHAALFFAAAKGYTVMCETRHDSKKLDVLAEVQKMCDSVQVVTK